MSVPTQQAPVSDIEKKIRSFIDAAVMANPSLEGRLNVAACVQYLQLPDSTFGWDATSHKTPGVMPLEFKIACLLPTIVNGLPPGSIIWMGNRPYARAEAISFVANRDLTPLSGITFRPFSEEEKAMYGIKDGDMAVVAKRKVSFGDDGVVMDLEGFGVIGLDETQPNHKGNLKVAMDTTRNRMQFVRTRAIRDMYNRHISISGISSEPDYDEPGTPTPAPHDPAKIIDIQNTPPKQSDAPANLPKLDEALEKRLSELTAQVESLGGKPSEILSDEGLELPVKISLMEFWIESNKPTEPEPPKKQTRPRQPRAPKQDTPAQPINVTPRPQTSNQAPVNQAPVTPEPELEHVLDDSPEDTLLEDLPVAQPQNQIAESITPEEAEAISNEEPFLDFDDEPVAEADPVYSGTKEQKELIRSEALAAGLPQNNGLLHAIAAAMASQPMSKLPAKIEALKSMQTGSQLAPAAPSEVAGEEDVQKLRAITEKVTKIGGKTLDILGGVSPYDVISKADAQAVKETTKKLEDWYSNLLRKK